jgi:HEAT repeat protein
MSLQDQVDPDLRVRAVQQLAQGSWAERSASVLQALLSRSSEPKELLLAAVDGLGRLRHAAAVPHLLEIAEEAGSTLTEAIAGALGDIGDASAEPGLIALLAAGDSPVQVAAAGALGRIGTAAAVEPLLEMTRGRASRTLKQEAKEAITSIQERLTGAEVGQLSVAEVADLEGALSKEQSQSGALSLESSSSS